MRMPDLFAIGAFVLLGFAFIARFIGTSIGISVAWRGTGYVIPPEAVAVAMATAMCFCSTIYSLWMLPFNRQAMLWHFWLTVVAIAVFWLSFYSARSERIAVWAMSLTPAAVLFAQIIFVWNVLQAISKMPRLHS